MRENIQAKLQSSVLLASSASLPMKPGPISALHALPAMFQEPRVELLSVLHALKVLCSPCPAKANVFYALQAFRMSRVSLPNVLNVSQVILHQRPAGFPVACALWVDFRLTLVALNVIFVPPEVTPFKVKLVVLNALLAHLNPKINKCRVLFVMVAHTPLCRALYHA